MRYHWGLGIGHVYSHGIAAAKTATYPTSDSPVSTATNQEIEQPMEAGVDAQYNNDDHPECSLEDLEDDLRDLANDLDGEDEEPDHDTVDDEILETLEEMFGPDDGD